MARARAMIARMRQSLAAAVKCVAATVYAAIAGMSGAPGDCWAATTTRRIDELIPTATIRVGQTADWVALTDSAVWVGSTGPNAVHRIDPSTYKLVASVALPGEPCAGLTTGFGSLWVPMCTTPPSLARVDLESNRLTRVMPVGPAAAEGGIAASTDSIWLVADTAGVLDRIDPSTGAVRQSVRVPVGSYNPVFSDGKIWVTRAQGSEITSIDAVSGSIGATTRTGPHPRFLAAGDGAIWTLNQGDGTLTRIDTRTHLVTATVALHTPGHGGDIVFSHGIVWTTMQGTPLSAVDGISATVLCRWVGAGGDSLGVAPEAIWLTNYHAGTISRISAPDALARCKHTGVKR